ncbi:MAG: type I-E CRISPR-associated endoribonuclease Cas2 [Ruminococcus sp.]|nr:type I-E CRISPR-associated endoribonuclease Cas2 [Ruminococcus sp.]
MIVVSMTNCPPKLRGDLSKWLLEINTGVYVGQVSSRVREALWKRICDNIGSGQATMVFSANNEQHLDFYVHNTAWQPIDLDGIKLMKHPERAFHTAESTQDNAPSSAAIRRMNKRRRRSSTVTSYVLLDIETTGLSCESCEILEIAAVTVSAGKITEQCSFLINVDSIPDEIEQLTGISMQHISSEGIDLKIALEKIFDTIDDKNVLIYNAPFDLGFLKKAAEKCSLDFPDIYTVDVMELARKQVKNTPDHKLKTVAESLGITTRQNHRALDDCLLMNEVYLKLNENH